MKVSRRRDLKKVDREARGNTICYNKLATSRSIDRLRSVRLFLWTRMEKTCIMTR